jgi:hypothetical protein
VTLSVTLKEYDVVPESEGLEVLVIALLRDCVTEGDTDGELVNMNVVDPDSVAAGDAEGL